MQCVLLVPHSHCPHSHRKWDTGELQQLLFHPIPSQPFCLLPPLQTHLLSYEFCIIITFQSLLYSLKSFCHSRLVTSPEKKEQQLLCGRSCSTLPEQHYHGSLQQPAQLPIACSTGKNHRQSCVFQREAFVWMRQMVLTASPLLHWSLKTRCSLWLATRLSTKLALSK